MVLHPTCTNTIATHLKIMRSRIENCPTNASHLVEDPPDWISVAERAKGPVWSAVARRTEHGHSAHAHHFKRVGYPRLLRLGRVEADLSRPPALGTLRFQAFAFALYNILTWRCFCM